MHAHVAADHFLQYASKSISGCLIGQPLLLRDGSLVDTHIYTPMWPCSRVASWSVPLVEPTSYPHPEPSKLTLGIGYTISRRQGTHQEHWSHADQNWSTLYSCTATRTTYHVWNFVSYHTIPARTQQPYDTKRRTSGKVPSTVSHSTILRLACIPDGSLSLYLRYNLQRNFVLRSNFY